MSLADQIKKSVAETREKQAKAKAEEERIRLAQRVVMQRDFEIVEENFEKDIQSLTALTIKGESLKVFKNRYDHVGYSLPYWKIHLKARVLAKVSLQVIWQDHTRGSRSDDGRYDEEWTTEHAGVEIVWEDNKAHRWVYTQDARKALTEYLAKLVMEEGE